MKLLYPTKTLMAFWIMLAGVNFYFFCEISNGARFFSLFVTAFCVWKIFQHFKAGQLTEEFNKQIKEESERLSKIASLSGNDEKDTK